MAGETAACSTAEVDGQFWPRLLACWHDGCLQTSLLHADGRRSHERAAAVEHAHQLASALAQVLDAIRRVVRHAVLVSNDAPPREALRTALGLSTLCLVTRDRALGLALPALAPTHWLAHSARRDAPVLCRLAPAALIDEHGHSPPALAALLLQPWQGSRLGDELHRPEALATLCGLLALAGHGHIALRGDVARHEVLKGCDWPAALERFDVALPAISWTDDDDSPCWAGAARALHRELHSPAPVAVSTRIRNVYAHLTPCERRVADVVLASPAQALEMATARLAEAAHVSQPQVIRFCRALGLDGVKALKRALAGSLAAPGDAPVGHPLLTQSLQMLAHLDRARLSAAARLLSEAAQIDVLADAERTPLLDLALRMLWRLGRPARPLQAGERPTAPVCLSLGACAGNTAIAITEVERRGTGSLQLVTGPESAAAPMLLATLVLQLLLAEIAPAPRRTSRTPAHRAIAALR